MSVRQGIQGDHEVESTKCPAGQCEAILISQWVHREEGKELEPGDWVRIEVGEKRTGKSRKEYRLLMDLEREEEEDEGGIYLQQKRIL